MLSRKTIKGEGGGCCSQGNHFHDQYVLIMLEFWVFVLGGVLILAPYTWNACCLGASNVCRPTKSRVSYNQICGDAMYIWGMWFFFFFFLRQMKQGLFHCQKTCKVTETQKKLVTKNLRTNSLLYGSYLVTHAYIGMTFGEACTLHRQITGLAISWALWYEHAYAKVHKHGFHRFQTHKYRWT